MGCHDLQCKILEVREIPEWRPPMMKISSDGQCVAVAAAKYPNNFNPRVDVFATDDGTKTASTHNLPGLREIAFDDKNRLIATADPGLIYWNRDESTVGLLWQNSKYGSGLEGESNKYSVLCGTIQSSAAFWPFVFGEIVGNSVQLHFDV